MCPIPPIPSGAIVDMDGTVLDTLAYWRRMPFDYLRSKGRVPPPDLLRELEGLEVPASARHLKEAYRLDETPETVARELYAAIRSVYTEAATLLPQAREVLQLLRRQGRRVALFTASEVTAAAVAMSRNGVLHCFDLIVNTAETGFDKSDPRAYLAVLQRLGTPPERTVVLEDAPYALKGARQAGMRVITPDEFSQLLENKQFT